MMNQALTYTIDAGSQMGFGTGAGSGLRSVVATTSGLLPRNTPPVPGSGAGPEKKTAPLGAPCPAVERTWYHANGPTMTRRPRVAQDLAPGGV